MREQPSEIKQTGIASITIVEIKLNPKKNARREKQKYRRNLCP